LPGLLGRGRRFLTHSTSLRAGSGRRLWLWLGSRRRSRVDGETAEAGFTQFKLRGWAARGEGGERFRSGQRPRWRRSRVEGSRAGLVLGMKAGLGEQLAPSPFYLCEGGQPGLS
jgi:hypothetical protein